MKNTFITLLLASSLHSADPLIGDWKLDPLLYRTEAASTFSFARDGEFYQLKSGGRFKLDLRDYPAANGETMDWRRSGLLYVSTFQKDGRVLRTFHNHVEPGGQRARVVLRNYSSTGQFTESERTYERIGGTVDPADPFVGEWRVGPITRTSAFGVVRFEPHGDGHRYIGQSVAGYAAAYDGKDYPYQSTAGSGAVSLRRLDDRTVEATFKQDGKPRTVSTLAVSEDGQTMTRRDKNIASGSVTTSVYRRHTLNKRAGVWKLNEAKSKSTMRNATLRYVERTDGPWFYIDGEYASGKTRHATGRSRETGTLSEDGNTLTIEAANGEHHVWERQPGGTPLSTPRAAQVRMGVWKRDLGRSWNECAPAKPIAEEIRTVSGVSGKIETKYADGTSQVRELRLGMASVRTDADGSQAVHLALDELAVENRTRKNGVLTRLSRSTISADGNTYTFFGWNTQDGRRCSSLAVYDRVN